LRHLVVTIHDVGERRVGVVVQLLIPDADALLVAEPGRGVGEQEFQDVVPFCTHARDGPEHAHLRDGRCEPMQDSERDGRLTGVALWRCYVDCYRGA